MYNVILIAGVFILLVMSLYIIDVIKRLTACEKKLFQLWTDIPYRINFSTAETPTKAHEEDAGWDLYAAKGCIIPPHGRACINTGIAMALPCGHYGLVVGRSGNTVNHGILVAPGIIDSNYRGNIGIMAFNTTDSEFTVCVGDRLGQLIIMPYLDSALCYEDELGYTDRGESGFGASGR